MSINTLFGVMFLGWCQLIQAAYESSGLEHTSDASPCELFSPLFSAAGAVFHLWTPALLTGNMTKVAHLMAIQVLSCRRRARKNILE